MQRTGAGWAAAQSDASAYNARSQRDTPQPEEQRSGSDGERLGWLILQNQKLNMHALLAQLVEQLTLNQRAQGSSPWKCTRYPLSREIWTVDFSYQKTHNILQLDRSEPVML